LLQEDLHKVYNWATTNNMQFNDSKFELLRYGKNYELKESTSYLSNNNQQIQAKASTKDLGITISATADLDNHIRHREGAYCLDTAVLQNSSQSCNAAAMEISSTSKTLLL
jgi:hypothetical protein